MNNFPFLAEEWPDLHESAAKLEALANSYARTACFYTRRTLELAVHWFYRSQIDELIDLISQERAQVVV